MSIQNMQGLCKEAGQGKRTDLVDNVNEVTNKPSKGNSRAYTLDRLHREAPKLYARVVAKELSANRAAILAGFRHEKTALEQLEHWWAKAGENDRRKFLKKLGATFL